MTTLYLSNGRSLSSRRRKTPRGRIFARILGELAAEFVRAFVGNLMGGAAR